MKGGLSTGPIRPPAPSSTSQASPMQRAMINRQQHARIPNLARHNTGPPSHSPSVQATSSSQTSSPSTGKSPGYLVQGGMSPPSSDIQAQQQMQQGVNPHQQPTFLHHSNMPRPPTSSFNPSTNAPSSSIPTGYYPSSFQKHYDQLGKLTRFLFPPFPVYRALFVLD